MSSRPLKGPYQVIVDGDMSADIISDVTIIQNMSMLSYDISWSDSTAVGDMSVQFSNTYSINSDGSVRNPGNWTTVPLSSTTTVSGTDGNGFIDIDASGSYAVRLVYNSTSGAGTMQAYLAGKVS